MSKVADEIQNLLSDGEIGVKEKIELLRLQLESERLATEGRKFKAEQRFLTKNFAAVLTATISLAAVLVSFSQVWVAKIHNDKELSVLQAQKDREMQVTQTQKEKEMTLLAEQQEKVGRLDAIKYFNENKSVLFGGDKTQREVAWTIFITTFSDYFSEDLLAKLDAVATSSEEKRALQVLRKHVLPRASTLARLPDVIVKEKKKPEVTVEEKNPEVTVEEKKKPEVIVEEKISEKKAPTNSLAGDIAHEISKVIDTPCPNKELAERTTEVGCFR
jgi:hypothetical protein